MLPLIDNQSLVSEGVARGLQESRLEAALAQLKPIFEHLSFGEEPPYHELDLRALRELEPEVTFVARWMARGPAADLATAGYQVMGLLDSRAVIPDLGAALESGQGWERIEAVRALARMSQPETLPLLLEAVKHPDLQTRRAAASALQNKAR